MSTLICKLNARRITWGYEANSFFTNMLPPFRSLKKKVLEWHKKYKPETSDLQNIFKKNYLLDMTRVNFAQAFGNNIRFQFGGINPFKEFTCDLFWMFSSVASSATEQMKKIQTVPKMQEFMTKVCSCDSKTRFVFSLMTVTDRNSRVGLHSCRRRLPICASKRQIYPWK